MVAVAESLEVRRSDRELANVVDIICMLDGFTFFEGFFFTQVNVRRHTMLESARSKSKCVGLSCFMLLEMF